MMYICQKNKKLTEEEILMLEKMIEEQIILSANGEGDIIMKMTQKVDIKM